MSDSPRDWFEYEHTPKIHVPLTEEAMVKFAYDMGPGFNPTYLAYVGGRGYGKKFRLEQWKNQRAGSMAVFDEPMNEPSIVELVAERVEKDKLKEAKKVFYGEKQVVSTMDALAPLFRAMEKDIAARMLANWEAEYKMLKLWNEERERPMMEKINKNKEIFQDMHEAFDFANAEATLFGYKLDVDTGVLTVEEYPEWDGFGEEPKMITKQFRLVEVRD